jgi:DNA-directed RNA polymerase alpha subunit
MARQAKQKRTCSKGHTYYKSSDCPTCPTCEKLKEPASGFLALLSNPARNTLLHYGIDTIQKLAGYTEKEILDLHGMGKASMPILKNALDENGLSFKDEGFLGKLSAPVKRALENQGIKSVEKLAGYTENEIMSLHGIGPSSMPVMKKVLKERGLSFKEK